jgi:hypothetical protein
MNKQSWKTYLAGCLGGIALYVLLPLCISAIASAPDKNITPDWWINASSQTIVKPFSPMRSPLVRLLVLSVILVPGYWLLSEYVLESKAGFPRTEVAEKTWWWTTTTVHTWHGRYWPKVCAGIGRSFAVIFGAAGIAYLAVMVISYLATGKRYRVEYGLLVFVSTVIVICVVAANLTSPVHHLLTSKNTGRRMWAIAVIAFEAAGVALTAHDILRLLH